ncbi:MAG: peptide ABC transporter substrate-binding protein, partial [Gammaproteobacteria bacterium]|nr:peptide ABC transporter substrate-binding protein [Gammaproteobacteria bacterium]
MRTQGWFVIAICLLLLGCHHKPRNDPYRTRDATANIYYGAYASPPKTLDPAKAYTTDEAQFVSLVYEPPLQYQYLTHPWTLEPLLATQMPEVIYKDAQDKVVTGPQLASSSEYIIHIRPGIYYQLHPAFSTLDKDVYRYWPLRDAQAKSYTNMNDFKQLATREVTADDFVYEIKRLASPAVQSPIYGLMSMHI